MTTPNNGGPAFPIPLLPGQSWHGMGPCDGATLRDYFAAKALQGLLSDSNMQASRIEFAAEAYAMADAMLQVRDPA